MRTKHVTLSLLLIGWCSVYVTGHVQVYDDDEDDWEDEVEFAKKEPVNPIRKTEFIQDKEHVQDHLKHKANLDLQNASKEEVEFHFFSSHDTDGDGMLDGLELFHSVEHGSYTQIDRIESNDKYDERAKKDRINLIYQRLIRTIDRILTDDDVNKDGYLQYSEFAKARLAAKTLHAATAL